MTHRRSMPFYAQRWAPLNPIRSVPFYAQRWASLNPNRSRPFSGQRCAPLHNRHRTVPQPLQNRCALEPLWNHSGTSVVLRREPPWNRYGHVWGEPFTGEPLWLKNPYNFNKCPEPFLYISSTLTQIPANLMNIQYPKWPKGS